MDQFFIAAEMLHRPWLRGKPAAVAGGPRGKGIVTSASYEARRFGISAGMTADHALELCPRLICVPPDAGKYVSLSKTVVAVLNEFTDLVEPLSVDEACMDVSDAVSTPESIEELGLAIKRRIREATGLAATVGGGVNRLVAKMASNLNKPDGCAFIPPERVRSVYENLPVGVLYGVGPATEKALHGLGIRTIGELADYPERVLRVRFGKYGADLWEIANGGGNDVVTPPGRGEDEKSMGHESTLGRDVVNQEMILARLLVLCERVARRLRAGEMAGRVVTLKLRYRGFETCLHGRKFRRHFQHESDIYAAASRLFAECREPGRPVRLIGVSVSDLLRESRIVQMELFAPPARIDSLTVAQDQVRDRFGERAIGYASGLISGKRYLHRARSGASEYMTAFRPSSSYDPH